MAAVLAPRQPWLAPDFRLVSSRVLTAPVEIVEIDPVYDPACAGHSRCVLRAEAGELEVTIHSDLADYDFVAWATAPSGGTARLLSDEPIFATPDDEIPALDGRLLRVATVPLTGLDGRNGGWGWIVAAALAAVAAGVVGVAVARRRR